MGNTQRELRSVLAGAVLLVVAHAGRADIIANLVAQVSEAEIQAHIAALEGPRASVASQAAAAAYVTGHFESLGYSVIHDIVGSSENVIATLPGQMTPELVFIIGAHFDTVSGSPGADDNASGVAGVLEIARVLAGTPVASSIELIAFGLEELGLMGSTQYAQAATAAGADIIGMLSLEMIAYTCATSGCQFPFIDLPPCLAVSTPGVDVGTFIAAVTNGASAGLRNVFVGAANTYVPGLHHEWAQVAGDGSCFPDTRRSDHAPFWDQGYPALMLTDTANFRNPNYHQPTDTLATLDLGFARLVTQAALAAAMMAVGPESATPTQTPQDSATPTSSATRPEASPLTPALVDTATPTPTTIICTGDCSGDGEVTINELITGVNIALGNSEVLSCPEVDANDDGEVAINELITAVNNALRGCPGGLVDVGPSQPS